jgi:hypothetical protein
MVLSLHRTKRKSARSIIQGCALPFAGRIVSHKVIRNLRNNQSLGYGFVRFDNTESPAQAIKVQMARAVLSTAQHMNNSSDRQLFMLSLLR